MRPSRGQRAARSTPAQIAACAAIAGQAARETVVVIGNGMVGYRFCEQLVASEHADRFRIAVFGEEPIPAYNRIRLSEMLSGQPINDPDSTAHDHAPPVRGGEGPPTIDDLLLAPRAWYDARGIDLHTGDPVVAIDRPSRTLRARSGKRVHYDRVVLATGAKPRRPLISGIDEPGVLTYRDVGDLAAIRAAVAGGATRAIVVGGGVLGLELAWTLADLGISAHILEAAPALMTGRLDPASSGELKNRLEARGIAISMGVGVAAMVRKKDRLQVRLRSGELLWTDVAVVCAGVVPRDSLARQAGLRIADTGGIWVGDDMRTSDPRIYAIGDCARHRGAVYGQISPGYQMAGVAAKRLLGERARFSPPVPRLDLTVGELRVTSIGDMTTEHDIVTAGVSGDRRAIAVSERRLEGACAVGAWQDLVTIESAIGRRERIRGRSLRQFSRTGNLARGQADPHTWPETAIVCQCAQVTKGAIVRACGQNAGLDVVMHETGAGSGCGSCRPLVATLCGGGQKTGLDRRLLWLSVVSAVLLFAIWALPQVLSMSRAPGLLGEVLGPWRAHLAREISGFVLLGMCLLGLIMPIARRLKNKRPRLRWMKSSVAHVLLGGIAVIALFAHTGHKPTGALNLALAATLTAAMALGALLGITRAVQIGGGMLATPARTARWPLLILHLFTLALLPALIGVHVLAVYLY